MDKQKIKTQWTQPVQVLYSVEKTESGQEFPFVYDTTRGSFDLEQKMKVIQTMYPDREILVQTSNLILEI